MESKAQTLFTNKIQEFIDNFDTTSVYEEHFKEKLTIHDRRKLEMIFFKLLEQPIMTSYLTSEEAIPPQAKRVKFETATESQPQATQPQTTPKESKLTPNVSQKEYDFAHFTYKYSNPNKRRFGKILQVNSTTTQILEDGTAKIFKNDGLNFCVDSGSHVNQVVNEVNTINMSNLSLEPKKEIKFTYKFSKPSLVRTATDVKHANNLMTCVETTNGQSSIKTFKLHGVNILN